MTRFLKYLIPALLLILLAAVVVVSAMAGPRQEAAAQAEDAQPAAAEAVIPDEVHFQGFLLDDVGDPMDGPVDLQFDLFEDEVGGISLWSQTYNNVDVDQGYFSVQLGPLTAADFKLPVGATTLYIQVSILPDGGGSVALPRQPLASAPYAFLSVEAAAAPWDGLTGVPPGFADNVDDVEFQNVVTVAKSGAQFTSIQEAIDSITDADSDNRYLVWIGPGFYTENVVTKSFVYLTGAGQWLTRIQSDASNPDVYPPAEATLMLSDYVNVSNLTVQNIGQGYRNVAILALDGVAHNKLIDVVALANGLGQVNIGTLLYGANTNVRLQNVDSSCSQPALDCIAFEISDGAQATVHGGRFAAFNGNNAIGLISRQPETRLNLFDVTVEAADSAQTTIGLLVNEGAIANVHGGSFEARNGITDTFGILLYGGAAMEATSVVAYGHSGPNLNRGLANYDAQAILHGGAFTGWGGQEALGILNSGGGASLEANNVKANGENAAERNDGLRNEGGAGAMLNGGFFYGQGGGDNRGIANYDEGSVVDLQHGEVQGESDMAAAGFGLTNESAGTALVSHSELAGPDNAVLAEGATTQVYLSRLAGGPIGGAGAKLCLAIAYSGSFYPDICP